MLASRFGGARVRWILGAALAVVAARGALAQNPVTRPPAAIADTIADTLKRPPIAPRRAMLLSLVIPGAAQAKLKRPTASMVFATMEIFSLGMARQAAQDLREAKAAKGDSVASSFTLDPVTGIVTPGAFTQNRLVARIPARHAHYEDWIAAVIFNHIISSVDAYVAANLWDFKANVAVAPSDRGAAVTASVAF